MVDEFTTPCSSVFYPLKWPGSHCTANWVVPRSGLEVCGKPRLSRETIPGSSNP